ncbi:MAG: nitroreductase family protein [Gammaproteobacteria bacterium]|nr:nitroreductase family protein [Gammaproteobacteria bacterium]
MSSESSHAEEHYRTLLDIVKHRSTNRAFDPEYIVPDEHFEMILEVARHAPSGANSQPWHYIVVRDAAGQSNAYRSL